MIARDDKPCTVAVTVSVPSAAAVTDPLGETDVARFVPAQLTTPLRVLPAESRAATPSCNVQPTNNVAADGATTTDAAGPTSPSPLVKSTTTGVVRALLSRSWIPV